MHPKHVSVNRTLLSLDCLCLTGLTRKEWKGPYPHLPHLKESWFPVKKIERVFPSNISDSFYIDLKW